MGRAYRGRSEVLSGGRRRLSAEFHLGNPGLYVFEARQSDLMTPQTLDYQSPETRPPRRRGVFLGTVSAGCFFAALL